MTGKFNSKTSGFVVCEKEFEARCFFMPRESDTSNMAIYADFENVAIGAQQAKYAQFDINKILERILVKGNIVMRKAYCDWNRYSKFKRSMHEANFELVEIPHLSMSGKNSADIRMVVDALDLCYTKPHIDTFVIISGDSDFSPLVSKLRENDKIVIGVGVKQSTSDLFVANCDEFIFYDDLVRAKPKRKRAKSKSTSPGKSGKSNGDKKDEAVDLVVSTVEKMIEERGSENLVWASMIKQAIKRQNPGFNEGYYGFSGFNSVLEEARDRGLLILEPDEKSGSYIVGEA